MSSIKADSSYTRLHTHHRAALSISRGLLHLIIVTAFVQQRRALLSGGPTGAKPYLLARRSSLLTRFPPLQGCCQGWGGFVGAEEIHVGDKGFEITGTEATSGLANGVWSKFTATAAGLISCQQQAHARC